MNARCRYWLPGLLVLAALAPVAADESGDSAMERIGDERYRIGSIVVDRKAKTFTVPGKILHLDEPLEYLAVSAAGMKAYESLLELETSPRDFNLACILIGLDNKNVVRPEYQFDQTPVKGPAVDIAVIFEQDGKTVTIPAANALANGDETFDDDRWAYTGSEMSHDGKQFMAEIGGTLIGFVHDPLSVIEHEHGAGIGAYGSITGNEALLPPEGSAVALRVTARGD
ncbi:MAG: YdjY domain-containing protein [Woeseiaceae bacterium]|nr:YdjY domain-containing protein [Woeseiaceae bacterium]